MIPFDKNVLGGRGLGDGDDTRPVHHGRAGGELLRRRHGRVPELLQVQEHDRRHREVARARDRARHREQRPGLARSVGMQFMRARHA